MEETKVIQKNRTFSSFSLFSELLLALVLAACGGGGGGGGGGGVGLVGLPIAAPPPAPGGSPEGPAAGSTVTVNGRVTYDSVPNSNGPLVYSGTTRKPVRGATVEAIDQASSAQVAKATTSEDGAYALSFPAGSAVLIRVRAELAKTGGAPGWDVTVRDNTRSDALYTMQTSAFSPDAATVVRDLHAPSGWGGTRYTGERTAAPFAILDTVYTAMQKVNSAASGTAFPPLRIFWSANNAPSAGSIAAGQIGTTFFVNRSSGREIYVLGKEDVDTDEYDGSVIAHEWGHYYQSAFSRDDSMGGSHSLTQRLDRRLAFSEGWGNAWSGIALARQNYVDSSGVMQSDPTSIQFDLAAGAATTPGWFNEASIQSIFWNLHQQAGFKPIHDALTAPSFKDGVAVTSIHPFATTFNAVAPASSGALGALLAREKIAAMDGDPYGGTETNDGGIPVTMPMYKPVDVGGAATSACVSDTAGRANKLGNFAYLRFSAPDSRNYRFVFSGMPGGTSVDFDVFRDGPMPRSGNTVALSQGEHVVAVSLPNATGASTCFNVEIQ